MKTSKLLITSLLAAAAMGTSAYAGFVWNGGAAIRPDLWQLESSWTLTDGTTWPTSDSRAAGPLTPYSNAWNGVTVANASGTVGTFEGWALGLTLQNANLTVTTLNKFQGGCTLNLDAASVLSMTLNGSGTLAGNVTVNTEGVFNLKLDKNYTGGGFVANLGNGGVLNFSAYDATARTAKVSTLNATLNTADFDSYTIDANGNTVYTRKLITLGDNVSFDSTNTTVTMTAGAGVGTLTRVENISGADAGSYKLTKDSSGYSVSYVVAGTTYAWNATAADDSVWDTSAENWTTDGGSTSIAFENDKNVLFGAGDTLAKTVAIDSAVRAGTISVAEDYTFNVGASGSLSATAVAVAGTKTATLNLASNMALSANLGGSGTLKKTGTGVLTYSGTISSGATLEIASAGTTAAPNTFSGTLSAGGNLIVSGGAVVKHEIESGKVLSGNITITGDGSTFIQKGDDKSDQLNYDGTTSIVVKDGGTLALGSNRWTFNANNSLLLDGGNITGSSQSGNYGNLDFNAAKTLNVLNSYGKESTISASIRLRNNLTLNVIGDATLNITGKIGNAAAGKKIIKTGSGKMTLDLRTYGEGESAPSENFTGGLDVNGGEVEVRHANALGTGAVTVNGDGSILDFAVSGGTFTQGTNQALTTTNGGKITVSAGTLELAGAVNLSNAIEVASGAAVTTSGVKFALSGLTGKANEDGSTTFRLFTLASGAALTWDSLNATNLNFTGTNFIARGASATFNADGTMTVTDGTAGDLVWNGGPSGTWNYAEDNMPWTMGGANTAFVNNDNVTFAMSGDVAVTVASTGVTAGTVKITAGTVTLSGGKVTAMDKFIVESGATLKLSPVSTSSDDGAYVAGEVEVRSGGTLDMNGVGGASYGGLTTVTLAGGKLTNTGESKGTGARQFDSIVLTANSSVVADSGKDFGLVKSAHEATTLDLGAHKLTKSGGGSFVLVNTTISGNGGVLDVTEGTIRGLTADNKNIALGEGVTLKTSGTGGADNIKITSMGANSKLILGGSTASTVALSGALGTGAVIDVSGANAVTGTISSMALGSSLTLAGTGTASTISFTGATSLSGNLTIGNATVNVSSRTDIFNYNNDTIQNIELNEGGVLALGAYRQTFTNYVKFILNGGRITGDGSSDSHGYAMDFIKSNTVTVTADSEIAANMTIRRHNETGATLAFEVNDGATLTISGDILTPSSAAQDTNSVLVKQGKGTLVLSGTNTYNQGTRVEEGTVEVRNARGLGTNTVNLTGDATLQIGETSGRAALTVANNVAVASGKTLTLKSENDGNKLTGVISGAGSLKATYYASQNEALTLAGDNRFSGGLEVSGVKVSAEHANALGSGMLKISDVSVTYPDHGTITFGGSVNAAAANVVLHDVSLLANNSAQLTADASCNFTVAGGAVLYLDIGALTETVLTGEQVALTIAAASAFDNSFFSAVEVGTYGEDGSWVKDLQWAYVEGSWNVGAGTLSIAIPEPSVFGLLAGLGALALAGTRRRRRKA
ncbi:beta strand repeat-containing protein [Candidatus Spyradosoma sp. SGI.093]|uniref:beta strand repeat-containing protein n=1 Tax=Candidatus Spyradosoma sp. SGI.093 TaxID=3420583 RepID=UPI003D072F6D